MEKSTEEVPTSISRWGCAKAAVQSMYARLSEAKRENKLRFVVGSLVCVFVLLSFSLHVVDPSQ